MRIATWNVERLKHNPQDIQSACKGLNADIIVLTETDERIRLLFSKCISTQSLAGITEPVPYKETEKRVAIYTDYNCVRQYETYDARTAVCAELETEYGNLLVYGTIMGITGNRSTSYLPDVEKQMEDIRELSEDHSICVIGDYNCAFADGYYFTKAGRDLLNRSFQECSLSVLTAGQQECIDHIAVSTRFLRDARYTVEEWNSDKRLSDHKGIIVDIR